MVGLEEKKKNKKKIRKSILTNCPVLKLKWDPGGVPLKLLILGGGSILIKQVVKKN